MCFFERSDWFLWWRKPTAPRLLRVSAHVSTYLWPEHLHRWFLLISLLWCSVQPLRINKMETYDLICYLSLIKYSSLWLLWSHFLSLLTIIKVILLFSPPSPAPALISFIKSAVLHRDEGVYPPSSRRGRVFVSNWFYSNQQLKIVSSSLHSERISSEKSKHFIQTNHDSLVFLYSRRSRRLSAGCEGLPEEVLAAGFPLSGGEQRAAAGGALQVDADVFGFTVGQREVLLFQSLVLHLQEVREEQLCQRGPRHVLKTRQDEKHTNNSVREREEPNKAQRRLLKVKRSSCFYSVREGGGELCMIFISHRLTVLNRWWAGLWCQRWPYRDISYLWHHPDSVVKTKLIKWRFYFLHNIIKWHLFCDLMKLFVFNV